MKNTILIIIALGFVFGTSACAQNVEINETADKSLEKREKVKRDEPLKVGETAPDFSLNTTDGKKIKLSEVKEPTMLVFYRGHW